MKWFFTFLVLVTLFSCTKYDQTPTLRLNGTWILDKIITQDSVYSINEVYQDSSDFIFFTSDTITNYLVGDTIFQMDYSMIRTNPQQIFGGTNWEKEYYYVVHGQSWINKYGYIYFNSDGQPKKWQILENKVEYLELRIQQKSDGKYISLELTRIGP